MKKKRTAKQKAATKKLVAMNKKRTRVSKTATKVITKTKRRSVMKRKSMSKRRMSKSMFGKGLLNKGLGIANNELVVKGLKGIGAATILTGIVSTAAPSVAQRSGLIIPAVVGTAAGGYVGGIAAIAASYFVNRGTGASSSGTGGFA